MDRKEYLKQYRKLHRPKQRAYQKAWRKAHPDYEAAIMAKYRAKYPERVRLTHRKQHLKVYGLTIEQFNQMLVTQNHQCKICGTKEPKGFANQWAVDHCHRTGIVRGLLCTNCNKGIGYFNDSPFLLREVIKYLEAAHD